MWFLGYRFRFHFLFNLSICPSTFVFWALSIIYFDTLTSLFLGLGKSFIKYIFPKDAKTRNVTNASMDLHQNHIPLWESDAMISDRGRCHCSSKFINTLEFTKFYCQSFDSYLYLWRQKLLQDSRISHLKDKLCHIVKDLSPTHTHRESYTHNAIYNFFFFWLWVTIEEISCIIILIHQ